MTLRDYFAAKALRGFVRDEYNTPTYAAVATACYQMADAMLAAREQK